jgi:hypothetical protein
LAVEGSTASAQFRQLVGFVAVTSDCRDPTIQPSATTCGQAILGALAA